MNHPALALSIFTPAERRLIRRLRTPILVQRFLNRLPYNTEAKPGPETLRSLRQVLRHRTAHCLEAALFAACILEQYGFPPLARSERNKGLRLCKPGSRERATDPHRPLSRYTKIT